MDVLCLVGSGTDREASEICSAGFRWLQVAEQNTESAADSRARLRRESPALRSYCK